MKLYAQHGYAAGDKIKNGLKDKTIDGIIFSARYEKQENLSKDAEDIKNLYPQADILLDPEFYAYSQANSPNPHLRELINWWPFFTSYRRSQLESTETIENILNDIYKIIIKLPLTNIIAPNIYIPASFNSIESVIAKNFIRKTRLIFNRTKDNRKVFSTLAIGRDALLDQREFQSFLNDITALDNPPDGFYILIGAGLTRERADFTQSELMHADVIANWMLLNYTLALNGFIVINGCSDILSPFLGAVGGFAGATGWWTNLRLFSISRYIRSVTGGRLPVIRYLSNLILNRITFSEREAIASLIPEINNNLPHDKDYQGEEPSRNIEVLQTWEAIFDLNNRIITEDVNESLSRLNHSIDLAESACANISAYGFQLNIEQQEYIDALREGIKSFKRYAEL